MIRSGLAVAGGPRLNGGCCEASQGSLEGLAKTGSYGRIRCVGDLCKGSEAPHPHRPLASCPRRASRDSEEGEQARLGGCLSEGKWVLPEYLVSHNECGSLSAVFLLRHDSVRGQLVVRAIVQEFLSSFSVGYSPMTEGISSIEGLGRNEGLTRGLSRAVRELEK
ncbi:uncharacterized protein CCOS01_14056 [Colletotrichum costaricense]|uniref:Uncharacterized protein n=1 Tax=Colletotrichum costaricense TaxID=1209916 RepID=A0AAI9YK50_9PEZI|nr:uncharacterized protein CCOS01_14056 [Colletotrichum costaricense]KAK1514116.1 hypothetical protein CCOS01_14056 [Colletotrichum costaricense]